MAGCGVGWVVICKREVGIDRRFFFERQTRLFEFVVRYLGARQDCLNLSRAIWARDKID